MQDKVFCLKEKCFIKMLNYLKLRVKVSCMEAFLIKNYTISSANRFTSYTQKTLLYKYKELEASLQYIYVQCIIPTKRVLKTWYKKEILSLYFFIVFTWLLVKNCFHLVAFSYIYMYMKNKKHSAVFFQIFKL